MAIEYFVALSKLIKECQLETVFLPDNAESIMISSQDVNRPGLILSGYEKYFDSARINFFGKSEMSYIDSLDEKTREERLYNFISQKPCALVITRDMDCPKDISNLCKKFDVPILKTSDTTSRCLASVIGFLNVELAERITRHGVFVEVYGEGVLILGDSGIGKSEAAVELIKRGHRLIADDAVEIKKTSAHTLIGTAPDNIRYFIELRGIGIINAKKIFGMGAVKISEKINMVIDLKAWDKDTVYEQMGLESETTEILGVKVPYTVVPIKPGRNLAVIIEVAAMNNRQKKMGYNAAKELMQNLGMVDDIIPEETEVKLWNE